MQLSDFDYELPDNLIAQEPLDDRSRSRMLVIDRTARTFSDDHFSNFAGYLNKGDVLVLNDTKVFPARLLGRSETGAAWWKYSCYARQQSSNGKRLHVRHEG